MFLSGLGGIAQSVNEAKGRSDIRISDENPDAAFRQIKQTLNKALEEDDDQKAADCYGQLGDIYLAHGAYIQALDNYYKAEILVTKLGDQLQVAAYRSSIGRTNFANKQYSLSLKAFNQSLQIFDSHKDAAGVANALADIGKVYEKQSQWAKAEEFQQKALTKLSSGEKDKPILCRIYGNLGSIHEDKMELDSAKFYFEKALLVAEQIDDELARVELLNNIGDVYRKSGHLTRAMEMTRQATRLSDRLDEPYQLASAQRDLAKTFALMGQYDSAYHYSELGREVHASIFSEDNSKQITVLQTLFELEQKDAAITEFKRQQKQQLLFLLLGAVVVVLLIFLAISIISRQRLKLSNQQQLAEQRARLYDSEKKSMAAEIDTKRLKADNLRNELELKGKELTAHTLHIIQKNQLLEQLSEKLTQVVKNDKRDQRKELKQILNLIQLNHNQDKSWEDFRIVFEKVHDHFFDALKEHADTLTPSDLRLAALLKMNLGSPDISAMLGISPDSLRISRYRLRKKLNLSEGESLINFLQGL